MPRIIFPSILHSKEIAYVFDPDSLGGVWDSWYRAKDETISPWAGQFDTYGDGLTAHSPTYAASRKNFGDYFASFAAYLLQPEVFAQLQAKDDKLRFELLMKEPSDHGRESMLFALSIKHREGKKQYFNLRERKLSSAESKQFDKRWVEVVEWMNGTVESAYGILCEDGHRDMYQRYVLWDLLRDLHADQTNQYVTHPYKRVVWHQTEQYADLPTGAEDANTADQGFDAFRAVLRAIRALDSAQGQLGCYLHNSGALRKQEEAAKASAAEEAQS